jgi:GxxExxY protein
MLQTKEQYDELTGRIIGCAIEVHKELGPGLIESVYEVCFAEELIKDGLQIKRQVSLPVFYKGRALNKEFIIDLLIEDSVVVELKSIELILPVHEAQLVTYLKLSDKKIGLLINFNVPVLKDGIRRRINGYFGSV